MRGVSGALAGVIAVGAFAAAVGQPPGGGAKASKDAPKADVKPAEKAEPQFKSSKDKASYAIGLNIGRTILHDFGRSDAVDADQFLKGLKAGLAGEHQGMGTNAIREAILSYRQDVIKEDATKFLDENKKKEGVKTTASGLQYEVLRSGEASAKKAYAKAKVKAHYTGTLVNGTKFDSSVDKGEPLEFKVKVADAEGPGVIQGWVEGLQLMRVGDKYRLFIPPDLGYGARGSPPAVPPHAVLIFEVELLAVE